MLEAQHYSIGVRTICRSPTTTADFLLYVQVIVTGHLPTGAVGSTVHVQSTIPKSSACFWISPESLLADLSYTIVIVHVAVGTDLAVTDAFMAGLTGEVKYWIDAPTGVLAAGFVGVMFVFGAGVSTTEV